MKIKIAHIAGGLTSGGVEAVIYNYFSAMNRDNYELHYITYDTPNEEVKKKFENIGFTVHQVAKKKEHFFKSCMQVYTIFKSNDIAIVHSHMTLMSFVTSVIGIFTGAKVRIAHSHLAQKSSGWKRILYGLFKWLTVVTSTDYFACGEDAAVFLYGEKRVNRGKVTILHNSIQVQKFLPEESLRREIRERMHLTEKICYGHVGRFTEQKNHDFLIDIYEELHRIQPESILMLIGEGPLEDRIKKKVAQKGLGENVLFLGSREDVQDLYQAMDVFLLPSLYEGLALALVEAQCAGLPIITSDTVTREIALTEEITYMSLGESPGAWAEAIARKSHYGQKKNNAALLAEAGYDIAKEADKLDNYYRKSKVFVC